MKQLLILVIMLLFRPLGAVHAQVLPAPWQSSVVGDAPAGAASYTDGVFTSAASGADIQDRADAFRFVDQPAAGDVTITAHVESLANTSEWAKAGVMIRAGLGADARNVLLAVTPAHGLTFQHRDATGDATTMTELTGTTPIWLRLQRFGPQISGFTWTFYNINSGLALDDDNSSASGTQFVQWQESANANQQFDLISH